MRVPVSMHYVRHLVAAQDGLSIGPMRICPAVSIQDTKMEVSSLLVAWPHDTVIRTMTAMSANH
jgi:hypothetical protein